MTKLLPIIVISLVLAFCAEKNSKYDFTIGKYVYKDKFFIICMATCMVLFVGLRTRYNDTTTYIGIYEAIDTSQNWRLSIDWRIGSNPGFSFLNYMLKKCGFSAQSFLLFYAIITIGIYVWFIRKYTNNICFSVFLFLTIGGFVFALAAIKQCVAMAICLVATDRAINKKYFSFLLFICLAILFHPYAFMYLVVPFLRFPPFSEKTYISLVLFFSLGIFSQKLLGSLVNVTLILGEDYNMASFMGEGVHPMRLMVVSVPLFLAFVSRKQVKSCADEVDNLMINLTILNAEIMFIALFGTANYFARLANYFIIFHTISIPWLLSRYSIKSRKMLMIVALICYSFYFYYENAIKDSFDIYFSNITLWNYLKNI